MAITLQRRETMLPKSKRGGDVKKAPPGFYTAKDARTRLGLTQSAFQQLVTKGDLERVVPPLKNEGFYRQADVNKMAAQQDLFYLQHVSTAKYEHTTFARATVDDTEGIFDVIASLWGADKATPTELRRNFYRANDKIDYVVKFKSLVLGYINMIPYEPETLEATMSGQKRGWDIRQHDILPFEPGHTYDVVVGIAVRQDIPGHEYYAKRLIYGFFGMLCDLAREGIIIRRMYATSDQPFGIKISQDLGFQQEPARSGDLFRRFVLDMETTTTLLVRKYRAVQGEQQPQRKFLARKVIHDPHLEETLHQLLDALTDASEQLQSAALLLPLIDQLAESSQMTIEQQVLLRSIHERLIAQ